MGRIRKTISFKEKVIKKLDDERKNKPLSRKINEDYEEKYNLNEPEDDFEFKDLKGGKDE